MPAALPFVPLEADQSIVLLRSPTFHSAPEMGEETDPTVSVGRILKFGEEKASSSGRQRESATDRFVKNVAGSVGRCPLCRSQVDVGGGEDGALSRHRQRDRPPDPGARPGNQRDLVMQ